MIMVFSAPATCRADEFAASTPPRRPSRYGARANGIGGPLMSHNSFGHLFRVTTWGESHGAAIGCVVDGTPPGLRFSEAQIQRYLDERRPGQSRYTTQRQEPDQVRVLSGVMPGEADGELVSTGTPIALHIDNVDQRSKDYSEIARRYRPGHADITYDMKYGVRDYRGGGRSSARETATRVAAGAIARLVVPGLVVRGALVQIGDVAIDRSRFDWDETRRNPFFCPDAQTAERWADLLDGVRKRGSRSAPWSRSSRTACRPAWAPRSTASWTPTSPRASCRSMR